MILRHSVITLEPAAERNAIAGNILKRAGEILTLAGDIQKAAGIERNGTYTNFTNSRGSLDVLQLKSPERVASSGVLRLPEPRSCWFGFAASSGSTRECGLNPIGSSTVQMKGIASRP
jgi:hypothetical protein